MDNQYQELLKKIAELEKRIKTLESKEHFAKMMTEILKDTLRDSRIVD